MKRKVVLYGLFMAVFIFLFMLLFFGLTEGPLETTDIVRFALGAVLTGVFSSLIFSYQLKKLNKIQFLPNKDEKILLYDVANLVAGKDSSRGRLFLTNKRLVYKPLKGDVMILAAITDARSKKAFGLIKNRLLVYTDEDEYQFTVENPDEWVDSLAVLM